jgi:hypothetical protein
VAGSIPAKAVWQQELRHFMVSSPTGVQLACRLCGSYVQGSAAAAAACLNPTAMMTDSLQECGAHHHKHSNLAAQ